MTFPRLLLLLLGFYWSALAQPATTAETLVVLPFENKTGSPSLEWIGDSFPEILGERMSSGSLYVLRREERVHALDRLGIPTNVRPSRATCYRLARELDVDYVVFGQYQLNGKRLKIASQLLNMKTLRLSPEVSQEGPLPKLVELQNALSWDLLGLFDSGMQQTREQFLNASASIRPDVLENYVRGLLAASPPEQIRYFKEAIDDSSEYAPALLQLGKTYYGARDYTSAVKWLARVPKNNTLAVEANFYLGLAAYHAADFARAETAFAFVATRLPGSEVYNNLGVVSSRLGKPAALEFFRKAVEADPQEPDYRFNFAVNLYRQDDLSAAADQLREMLALRSNDSEARTLLETLTHALATGRGGLRTFPLERIKSEFDLEAMRGVMSGNGQPASKPGNGDSRATAH